LKLIGGAFNKIKIKVVNPNIKNHYFVGSNKIKFEKLGGQKNQFPRLVMRNKLGFVK